MLDKMARILCLKTIAEINHSKTHPNQVSNIIIHPHMQIYISITNCVHFHFTGMMISHHHIRSMSLYGCIYIVICLLLFPRNLYFFKKRKKKGLV